MTRYTPEQAAVYAAENGAGKGRTIPDLDTAQAYCDTVAGSDWWVRRFGAVWPVTVVQGHGNLRRSNARAEPAEGPVIELASKTVIAEGTLLHEMAHVAVRLGSNFHPDAHGHGEPFRTEMLALTAYCRGSDAAGRLAAAYRSRSLTIAVPDGPDWNRCRPFEWQWAPPAAERINGAIAL